MPRDRPGPARDLVPRGPNADSSTRAIAMTMLTSLLLAALLWVPVRTLTCYGDSGQPVDWYECAGADPLPGLAWGVAAHLGE